MPNPSKSVAPMPVWVILLVFLAGITLGGVVFAAAWVMIYAPQPKSQGLPPTVKVSDILPTDQVKVPTFPVVTSTTDQSAEKRNPFTARVDERIVALDVKWTEPRWLTKAEAIGLMTAEPSPNKRDDVEGALFNYYDPENTNEDGSEIIVRSLVWEAGKVTAGPDKDNKIFIVQNVDEGLGYWFTYTYLMQDAKDHSKVYAIGTSTSTYQSWQENFVNTWSYVGFAADMPNASIKGLALPTELILDNGKTIDQDFNGSDEFGTQNADYRFLMERVSGNVFTKVAETRDGHDVYELTSRANGSDEVTHVGCLYAFGPDGRVYQYASNIPGSQSDSESYGHVKVQKITWNDGSVNDKAYDVQKRTGCGSYDCADVISPSVIGPEGSLKVVGKTSEGDKIYEPANPAEHDLVKLAYESWYYPDGDKPDIQAFLKQKTHAVIFWKDAVGRWTLLKLQDLIPPAECGKPVIYLYPEKTTAVSVRLPSFIKVTVSEPSYPAMGWKTVAQPNGQLTMADGKTYGSLYWEGLGVSYEPPKQGFLVKDGEQESFLAGILPKYGLNATESKEFMDFWLPQMTGAPYYRVSFLTDEWSQAAPLYVNPKPQTSIRIFMDWQKLNAPRTLAEPSVVTPERNGFTLVEWGGLLYK